MFWERALLIASGVLFGLYGLACLFSPSIVAGYTGIRLPDASAMTEVAAMYGGLQAGLGVLFAYSFTKRFTWASHLVLGLSLGGAPLGAWIAVTGGFAWPPVLLGLAVLLWVAGFDVIYACQDYEHDVEVGLYSIPVRFGIDRALTISRILHSAAVLVMALVGTSAALGLIYWIGVGAIAALLFYEHRLVRPDDLTRVNMAFFNLNAVISVLYLVITLADLIVLGESAALWRAS